MSIKRIVVILLIALVLLGLTGVTALAYRAYRAPLGPALQATPTAMPADNTVVPTTAPATAPTSAPAVAQLTVCGESSVWNVLVLGSDAAEMRGKKGSDLTRIVRVDFLNRKITMYAFSRDLWVDTTGLGLTNPTINATQLGMVFNEARSRSRSSDVKTATLEATNVMARMLANNFQVSTDHYVALDLSQIPSMVDAVGGIPINIPVPITDPWMGITIPAGQQTLNGRQFIDYARAIPDTDFNRIQRNDLLMDALRDKLLDPVILTQIPQLYTQFNQVITTDLSLEQINHLSCLLKEVPAKAIIKDGVRPEWTSAGPVRGSLAWDKTSVFNRLKELGLIP